MLNAYISIGVTCELALSVLCYMTIHNDIMEKAMKKKFLFSLLGVMIIILAEIGASFAMETHSFRILHILSNVIGFTLSPFIPLLISLTFCRTSSRLTKLSLFSIGVNGVLTVLSSFYNLIFFVSAENIYQRGSLFGVYIFTYGLSMLTLFNETWLTTKRYQHKNRVTPLLLFAFILIGTTIQLVFIDLHTTWLSASLAITIYYAYFCELSEKYDALTQLLNRRAYECEIERLNQTEDSFLIVFDVDHFKKANDTLGHQFGDKSLVMISNCMRTAFDKVGLCYRIGGDEFCVISQAEDEQIILQCIEDFEKKLKLHRKTNQNLPSVTSGYVHYYKKDPISEAIVAADRALYSNKRKRVS